MRPWPAAMCQDFGVIAAGVFEGVGQDRQVLEAAVFVDLVGQSRNETILPLAPPGIDDRSGTEGIAEDVAEEVGMYYCFRFTRRLSPSVQFFGL